MPDSDAIDFAARAPVWGALAMLYLDTDLFALDLLGFGYVARVLAGSPYSVDELREVELWEVAPVVGANLRAVPGGEWLGFNEAWLTRECAARARRRSWWLRARVRLGYARWVRGATGCYWGRLAPMIAELRGGVGGGEAPDGGGVGRVRGQ